MNIVMEGHSLCFIGGMERVTCDLASHMSRRGHKVFLFTSDPSGAVPVYRLHESVTVVHATHGGRRKHLEAFQQQILNCTPDVCISSATDRRHWPWCAALRGTGIPLIISEHSTPEAIEQQLWNREERLAVMAAADVIHLLLPSYVHSLPNCLRHKVRVLPNAVTLPVLPRRAAEHPVIFSLGRLSWEKQNVLLVDAFALLAHAFPQWRLEIWGHGPEHGRLSARIKKAGLEDRAFLRGPTTQPEHCYAGAELICLSSCYEGFPGVVVEAMTAGLPVVAFAQCSGANELVQHGKTGLLAPEVSAASLAESLGTLMADVELRQEMGENGAAAAAAYAPEAVYDLWEQALYEAASHKNATSMQTLERHEAENAASPCPDQAEWQHWAATFRHCTERANLLVGDNQHLRRLIFQFPWLKRLVHPLYTWAKTLRASRGKSASLPPPPPQQTPR